MSIPMLNFFYLFFILNLFLIQTRAQARKKTQIQKFTFSTIFLKNVF